MWKPRWLFAVPLIVASAVCVAEARAADVLDRAGLFRPETVDKANAELQRLEQSTKVPVTIETVSSLQGSQIDDVLESHAERAKARGLYVLIAKEESKIRVNASPSYRRALPKSALTPVVDSFLDGFKKHDYDAGLLAGIRTIETQVNEAKAAGTLAAPAARRGGAVRPQAGGGSFGLGSLVGIGILILGVLFFVRLLGRLFSGGGMAPQGFGGPGQMGGMGRPGYGGGYGGGGGGGGFMSSIFGGLGGALAGNWIYDQFSGRHQGGTGQSSTFDQGTQPTGAEDWSQSEGAGGDWGGGGGESAGGDWGGGGGGGDAGAGGDW